MVLNSHAFTVFWILYSVLLSCLFKGKYQAILIITTSQHLKYLGSSNSILIIILFTIYITLTFVFFHKIKNLLQFLTEYCYQIGHLCINLGRANHYLNESSRIQYFRELINHKFYNGIVSRIETWSFSTTLIIIASATCSVQGNTKEQA